MDVDQRRLIRLVREQLDRCTDVGTRRQIENLLVPPRKELRDWDYGEPDEQYACWIVLEHPDSNTGIAYCERGFGPECPWGLLFLSGPHTSIGMDCVWFTTLSEAFRDSMAYEAAPPTDERGE